MNVPVKVQVGIVFFYAVFSLLIFLYKLIRYALIGIGTVFVACIKVLVNSLAITFNLPSNGKKFALATVRVASTIFV